MSRSRAESVSMSRARRRFRAPRLARRADGVRGRAGVALLLLLALLALAVFLFARIGRTARQDWERLLSAMADQQEAAVQSYLAQRSADARVFSAFPTVLSVVSPEPSESVAAVDGGSVEHLRRVLEVGRAGWRSASLHVLDEGREPRMGVGEPLPPNLSPRLAALGPEASLVDVLPSAQGPRLVHAAPIRSPDGGARLGWFVIADDPAAVLWQILRRAPVVSRTGESLLVRQAGTALGFLSPLRHVASGTGPAREALESEDLAARHALAGRDAVGAFRDYRGERVYAAVRRIEGTGWGLVVKIDREEVLSGVAGERAWGLLAILSLACAVFAMLRAVRSAERLRSAAELQREAERHRVVLEQVRDAVVWHRPADGRILEANGAAEELWGLSHGELLGRTLFELLAQDDAEETRRKMSGARRAGGLIRARGRRKDGRLFPADLSARAVVLGGEEILVSVVRDVSESEEALEKIRFLNRILRTLSAVDQVLVEERDRGRILRRTCDEIVATGGFRAAWFGARDADGRLALQAVAGHAGETLERAVGCFDASAFDRGAAGTALREGRTVVVNDWRTDPEAEPWRDAELARGVLSSAACPVGTGGTAHGVLSLLSAQPETFTEEAVLLLEELSRDLGLALDLAEAEGRRRQVEESLARTEAGYRRLFEDNPGPMWVFDVETLRFLAVNDAAVSLYGYAREEFLGMTLREIRPPEDVNALEADVLVARAAVRRSGPWRHVRRGGDVVLVEIDSHDVTFDGRPARLVLVNDLTEKLKTEEKLRAFFDSGMVGAFLADGEGRITSANDEFLRIVGHARTDVEAGALSWKGLTPPEWLETDVARAAETRERGVCTPYEKEYLRKDGTRVPVLIGFALVGERRKESVAFVLDLTERKAADEELRRSEERFTRFLDWLPAAAWVKHADGRVLWANRFLETLLRAGPLPGRTNVEVLPEKVAATMSEDDRRAAAGESVERREEMPGPDGTIHVFRTMKFPVPGREGEVWAGGISFDVTAQVRAEEEVLRLNAELEERVERRTEELLSKSKELEGFAYSVSHDLRAPLRAIDGFSRMVEEDHAASLDAEGRRLLGVVRDNARRMGRLIDDLLAFSRAGRQDLRRSRVDVAGLVRSVVSEVVPPEEQARTDVAIGDLPPLQADPALLRQVFVNLLSNAVKFSSTKERRRISVSGRREEGLVRYDVSDNGVGFDMRYAGKLFGVFQRLHGREFEGTGVGLALAERIVSRHGGTIHAWAEPDVGARFSVSFPEEGEDV